MSDEWDAMPLQGRRAVNSWTRGDMRLHYEARTVTLRDMDGDAAMRLLAIAADAEGADRWADPVDPETVSALTGWVLVRTGDTLLAVEWDPQDFVMPQRACTPAERTGEEEPGEPPADAPPEESTPEDLEHESGSVGDGDLGEGASPDDAPVEERAGEADG